MAQVPSVTLPLPLLMGIVATRAALGVGVGLLIADKIDRDKRRRVGAALAAVGAITTVPALIALMRARRNDSGPDLIAVAVETAEVSEMPPL